MNGISPAPGTGHHDSFFFMHVQGQEGVLVHVTFVLPDTLSGPQVPQLDLWEEAQEATEEGPAGTVANPRHGSQGGGVVSKDLFGLGKSKPQTPEA